MSFNKTLFLLKRSCIGWDHEINWKHACEHKKSWLSEKRSLFSLYNTGPICHFAQTGVTRIPGDTSSSGRRSSSVSLVIVATEQQQCREQQWVKPSTMLLLLCLWVIYEAMSRIPCQLYLLVRIIIRCQQRR